MREKHRISGLANGTVIPFIASFMAKHVQSYGSPSVTVTIMKDTGELLQATDKHLNEIHLVEPLATHGTVSDGKVLRRKGSWLKGSS